MPEGANPINRLERRKQRTRAALIKAAQRLIAEGKVNVPVLEITQAADVGMGSFYNHFDSKEQLFEAAVIDVLDAHGAMLDRLTEASQGSLSTAVGRRVTGVQLGSALAYLAGKVLGQYEVFLPPEEYGPMVGYEGAFEDGEGPVGRLSLVAPNIAAAERALGVNPRDFRRAAENPTS